jgi:high-affinity Fe2+/Pb2+ permease
MNFFLIVYAVIVIVAVAIFFFAEKKTKNNEAKVFMFNKIKKYYLSVFKPISLQDEKSVPIKNLFVHPIRGIRALPIK